MARGGCWVLGQLASFSAVDHIEIRPAGDADVAAIVGLIEDRIGEEDAPEAALVLSDPTFDRARWTVAVDGGQVVSTMAAFPMTFHYGSLTLAATNFEFVATAKSHEGRGLVRRQFEYHHALAAEHGELIQIIVGIPYFYRKLGYEYALQVRPLRILQPEVAVTMPEGWEYRIATPADTDLVMGLQAVGRRSAAVAFAHTEQLWRFILTSPVYRTVIGLFKGKPRAMARVYLDDGTPILTDVVAGDADGLAAVVTTTRESAPGKPTFMLSRAAVDGLLSAWEADDYTYGYYVRIADPVAFLNAIRPVLEHRLGVSAFEGQSGRALISQYRSSIEFEHDRGRLSAFTWAGPEPAPGARGGAGVPPDLFCTLVLGGVGVDELARRHPDLRPGKLRDLLRTMFPKAESDVASWVVP